MLGRYLDAELRFLGDLPAIHARLGLITHDHSSEGRSRVLVAYRPTSHACSICRAQARQYRLRGASVATGTSTNSSHSGRQCACVVSLQKGKLHGKMSVQGDRFITVVILSSPHFFVGACTSNMSTAAVPPSVRTQQSRIDVCHAQALACRMCLGKQLSIGYSCQ